MLLRKGQSCDILSRRGNSACVSSFYLSLRRIWVLKTGLLSLEIIE